MAALVCSFVHASSIGEDVQAGACFYRFEDGGLLNIWPVDVRVDGQAIGTIPGGDFLCKTLPAGSHVVEAWSDDPYPRDGTTRAWHSRRFRFAVPNDSKVYLRISPISNDSAYVGPWRIDIEPESPQTADFPANGTWVTITIADGGNCVIRDEKLPCANVLDHLRGVLKLPAGSHVHLVVDKSSTYESTQTVIQLISKSEYAHPMGYVNFSDSPK